eukprot:TRINITY_DN6641_c0_g2_i1.p1 TRINITY_DN6641_c0_g2~~TRINITY_DN6641_c0_g2_i1.p1  ORF type:complete len:194 (-),score=25.50 TRINITY_DN6641_c0_g2_i1:830-1411(-)
MAFVLTVRRFLVVSFAVVETHVAAELGSIDVDVASCSHGEQACHNSLLQHKAGQVYKSIGQRDLSVYVYDFPDVMQRSGDGIILRTNSCSRWPEGSESELDCLFGGVVDIEASGRKLQVRVAKYEDWKGSARIVFKSLQRHPRRTYNADEADLFFIPVYDDLCDHPGGPDERYCPSAEFLAGILPHLNNATAS